jgi:hypothetical protein
VYFICWTCIAGMWNWRAGLKFVVFPSDPKTGDNFTCTCMEGFEGPNCNKPYCLEQPCQHEGTCDVTGLVSKMRHKVVSFFTWLSVRITKHSPFLLWHIKGCIQKFLDWPHGVRTANGTALCH